MSEEKRPASEPERTDPDRPWRVEGSREEDTESKGFFRGLVGKLPGGRRGWIVVAILLMLNWAVASRIGNPEPKLSIPYSEFRAQLAQDNLVAVVTRGASIEGTFKRPLRYPANTTEPPEREFTTVRPALNDDGLLSLLLAKGVSIDSKAPPGRPIVTTLLVSVGPTLLFIVLFFVILRRFGTGGGMSGLGRSKARRYESSAQRTTFADVAGIEEAEQEVAEIVDFLRDPDKYRRLGGDDPARGPALRPAGHRQDAAGPCDGG